MKIWLSLVIKIMLPDRFWAFSKKYIYEEKCEQSQKRKISVKNIIINQISLEHLANIYYSTAFLEL